MYIGNAPRYFGHQCLGPFRIRGATKKMIKGPLFEEFLYFIFPGSTCVPRSSGWEPLSRTVVYFDQCLGAAQSKPWYSQKTFSEVKPIFNVQLHLGSIFIYHFSFKFYGI